MKNHRLPHKAGEGGEEKEIIKRSIALTREMERVLLALSHAQNLSFSAVCRDMIMRGMSAGEELCPGGPSVSLDRGRTPVLSEVVEACARLLGMDANSLVEKIVEDHIEEYLAEGKKRGQRLGALLSRVAKEEKSP